MLQIIQNKYKHITEQIRKVVFDPFPLNPGAFFSELHWIFSGVHWSLSNEKRTLITSLG